MASCWASWTDNPRKGTVMSKVADVRVLEAAQAAADVGLPESVQVALADIAATAREGLLALSVAAGLAVMVEMMEAEITARVGAQARQAGRPQRGTSRVDRHVGRVGWSQGGGAPAPRTDAGWPGGGTGVVRGVPPTTTSSTPSARTEERRVGGRRAHALAHPGDCRSSATSERNAAAGLPAAVQFLR